MPSALLQNVLFEELYQLSPNTDKYNFEYRSGDITSLYYTKLAFYKYMGYTVTNEVNYPSVGLFITILHESTTDSWVTLKLCTEGTK